MLQLLAATVKSYTRNVQLTQDRFDGGAILIHVLQPVLAGTAVVVLSLGVKL